MGETVGEEANSFSVVTMCFLWMPFLGMRNSIGFTKVDPSDFRNLVSRFPMVI